MAYENLLQLKNKTQDDVFVLACSHFFDIGYQNAKEIRDEDIKNVQGSARELIREIMSITRKIAHETESGVELVQFCMAEDIFDVRNYANKISRYKLEDMLKSRLSFENVYQTADSVSYICSRYGCDVDDMELLGIEIPDEYYMSF